MFLMFIWIKYLKKKIMQDLRLSQCSPKYFSSLRFSLAHTLKLWRPLWLSVNGPTKREIVIFGHSGDCAHSFSPGEVSLQVLQWHLIFPLVRTLRKAKEEWKQSFIHQHEQHARLLKKYILLKECIRQLLLLLQRKQQKPPENHYFIISPLWNSWY